MSSTDIARISVEDTTRKRRNTPTSENNDNDQRNGSSDADPLTGLAVGTTVPENFNAYRYKKMLTQGLMDISLFSANANQLRFILEYGSKATAPCYILASFIVLSLILQVGVGVMLLVSSTLNVNEKDQREKVYKFGNSITIAIFLITVINVFIAAFGGSIDVTSSSGLPAFKNSTSSDFVVNSTTAISADGN